MREKLICIGVMLFVVGMGQCLPAAGLQVTFSGGLAMFAQSKSTFGNKAQISGGYNSATLGLSIAKFVTPTVAIGIDALYMPANSWQYMWVDDLKGTTLITSKNAPKSLNLAFVVKKYFKEYSKLRLFMSAIVGVEKRWQKMWGDVFFFPEGPKLVPLLAADLGCDYQVSQVLGFSIAIKGTCSFRDPAQFVFAPTLGINLSI